MLTQALIIALAVSADAAYLRASSEGRRLAGHGGHDDGDCQRRTPRRELGLARTPLWEIHGFRLFAGFFVVHEAGKGGVHVGRCQRVEAE